MRKAKIKHMSGRRRTQLKSRHLRTMNRQKQFFVFIQPVNPASEGQ
ncbi:hypothetical protein [uncultured Shewanella sp.]|nr:hypothetical protein [uncultured Shewanella sp.]